MSRSNPSQEIVHPCTRWHEWAGAKDQGHVRYYDRDKKENVHLKPDFTFILLDEMKTVKGWNDKYGGIGANEVRDTTAEPMCVKFYKSPNPIATGIYADIRETVIAAGGHFQLNLYIAYRVGAKLEIGSLQFKGGALAQWSAFKKKHRMEVYTQAVRIKGSTLGKKGNVEFTLPKFELCEITPESDEQAKALDVILQEYLKAYLAKTTPAKAVATEKATPHVVADEPESATPDHVDYTDEELDQETREALDIPKATASRPLPSRPKQAVPDDTSVETLDIHPDNIPF